MTSPAQGEGIEVTGRHNPLAWILYFVPLKVEIDGQAAPGSWGTTFIAVPPGQHQVSVYFPYLFRPRCCEGSASVTVSPGQVTSVDYRAPIFITSPGKLEVH
jgi:hypothetical protein